MHHTHTHVTHARYLLQIPNHVTHTNESYHTHMNESYHTHMNESYHTHMNESYHTHTHTWMNQITHMRHQAKFKVDQTRDKEVQAQTNLHHKEFEIYKLLEDLWAGKVVSVCKSGLINRSPEKSKIFIQVWETWLIHMCFIQMWNMIYSKSGDCLFVKNLLLLPHLQMNHLTDTLANESSYRHTCKWIILQTHLQMNHLMNHLDSTRATKRVGDIDFTEGSWNREIVRFGKASHE